MNNYISNTPLGVAIIHIFSGLIVLCGIGPVLKTTPLALMTLATGGDNYVIAMILIVTGLVAIIPFFFNVSKEVFVSCIASQQVLLIIHFFSAAIAIFFGHYADGYVPAGGSYFIAVDQSWLIMITIWHTIIYYRVAFGHR
jgi:hypothetical protein